jgi:D-3-phosphoglycerate dehydrogenase
MTKKALITEEFHPILTEGLERMGYSCCQDWESTSDTVRASIHAYELLIINSKIRVDRNMLDLATRLKTIIRIGSGLEIIDQETCKEKNILVISTPEGNANAVAEHVLAFILSSYTNIFRAQTELMQGQWNREHNRGEELNSKVLAVIGCGNNGSRLINLLSGFNTEILIYDIQDIRSRIVNPHARQVSMEAIFQKADIVSFHLPLNPTTQHLIQLNYLKHFQKPIDLINTSRGGIFKEEDLWQALKEGYVKRAFLDVFEKEPIRLTEELKKLIQEGKLFVSPHIAGWTNESKKRMAEIAIEKIKSTEFL